MIVIRVFLECLGNEEEEGEEGGEEEEEEEEEAPDYRTRGGRLHH